MREPVTQALIEQQRRAEMIRRHRQVARRLRRPVAMVTVLAAFAVYPALAGKVLAVCVGAVVVLVVCCRPRRGRGRH